MTELVSTDIFHLLLFVIPGFITVWSFRYFTESKKGADFEYFALSLFFGLLILLFNEFVTAQEEIKKLINNPYAGSVIFSISGLFFGWFGSLLSRTKWFKEFINWLKSRHL